jgi:hypothetical protein
MYLARLLLMNATRRILQATLLAGLGFLLCLPLLHAQDTATIVGTVSDQSGAFVAGAKVTLVNQATQFTRSVETSASGQYVASSIPTGSYVIAVANAGFKQLKRTGVELTAASTITVDLQLSMGAETQTVAVFGTAPLLQAQTADVSALVDSRQMTAHRPGSAYAGSTRGVGQQPGPGRRRLLYARGRQLQHQRGDRRWE